MHCALLLDANGRGDQSIGGFLPPARGTLSSVAVGEAGTAVLEFASSPQADGPSVNSPS